jgi:nicotinate dehydrogenase subunit B
VSRDGHHLYPAHPYTAFAKVSDADLQALYAYLMAQPPVATVPPATQLAFPFNLRPLLAGWNALFLRQGTSQPDPARSAAWNRGAYLVEGLGHCGGCHTPRNALGAEKKGTAHLAGGFVEGWEAPPLTALSHAPIPWTEDALFAYLRTGAARFHGAAAGPMAPVVAELGALPDADIRAMAVYLASVAGSPSRVDEVGLAQQAEQRSGTLLGDSMGARLYAGACAACHEAGASSLGEKASLALNSNLHSSRADNLIQAVLHGVTIQAHADLGDMPGFADSFSDSQVAALASYLRERFAPGKPAWAGLDSTVARLRASTGQ